MMKKRIQEVDSVSGSGTSMVSLYISSGSSISSERQRMSQEKSEAQNIKSDENRKNVEKAIEKVNDILKRYSQTPDNGLVVFAGVTENGPIEFVFDSLDEPLEYSDYTCDNTFYTEPLLDILSPDYTVGLLVIERGGCVIGELRGTRIKVHYDDESDVMGKHNAGGFSNRRFDRRIEIQRDNYFESVSKKISDLFLNTDNTPSVDSFVIGGTMTTADNFISDGYLPQPLDEVRIGGSYSVDLANPESLEDLVEMASDEIDNMTDQKERKLVKKFLQGLRDNSSTKSTYGRDFVDKALNYGAVDTLLLSEDTDRETILEYENRVENQGGDLVTISGDFTEGEQFIKGFNGIGALLRFNIE